MIFGGSELIEFYKQSLRGGIAVVPILDGHGAHICELALAESKPIKLSVVKHEDFLTRRRWWWAHGLPCFLQETAFLNRLNNPLLLGCG